MNMKRLLILLLCLFASVQAFGQTVNDDFLFLEEKKDTTNFQPIFNSIDEMVGKNVRFVRANYQKQIGYVYTKRGKRIVKFSGSVLPFNKYEVYQVEDIVIDKEGKQYLQLYDKKNDNVFCLYSPYPSSLCNMIYDYDEVQRMKEYVKKYFVYREVEYGETVYKKPYDYLPYVEVGISGVDIFESRFDDSFTVKFYYFTNDSKDRFVDYNMIDVYAYKFLSEEELQQKNIEYKKQQELKMERLKVNYEKYGIKIATAIFKGGFWNEELVDKLIEAYGKEEAEYIVSGEVHIGMTKDACELSWGTPDKINKTTFSFGVKEQWVYREKNSYLYFEDGVLTAFTEND